MVYFYYSDRISLEVLRSRKIGGIRMYLVISMVKDDFGRVDRG